MKGRIAVNDNCAVLFFLGMVTERPECSEWWGQSERYHYHGKRLFIGDRLARINIIYADDTMETIPVIFGVNVWAYELFSPLKENEKGLNNYGGPYQEPFASEPAAMNLLENSLVLLENDAEKSAKYIFSIKVKDKTIREAVIIKEPYKEAGIAVSAVTSLKCGYRIKADWKVVEPDFFLKHEYHPAMDQLARRLYQFRDEIPQKIEPVTIQGDHGLKVKFSGNPAAEIYSNVYMVNLDDMANNKVDENGKSHTSSKGTAYFGSYIGMGTYHLQDAYYSSMWSRDVGRTMIEITRTGIHDRMRLAAQVHHSYLYDGCIKYHQPHWKRIANGMEIGDDNTKKFLAGKENDGHASLMLFIYNLYACGVVDSAWLKQNSEHIHAAADWFFWQIENPSESNFDKVLYSESEASTQQYGGYDLYSNTIAFYALQGYAILAKAADDKGMAEKCLSAAILLRKGILERFTTNHPRYGKIFTDTIDDCWTWEYKRFAPLFAMTDIFSYDASSHDAEWYHIAMNTYCAQKEDYFSHAAGRQMGYGQGYLTETAILLDEFEDMAGCMEMAAYFCYHHTDLNYIVPEGVIMHPSGAFWFRNSDLGNAVQQGEIVKCGRLLIGLDDNLRVEGLHIIPRLPNGWTKLEVSGYGVSGITGSGRASASVSLIYEKLQNGWRLFFKADKAIRIGTVRIGPFPAGTHEVTLAGASKCTLKEASGKVFAYIAYDGLHSQLEIEVCI
jgi:hypothetical protein